MRIIVVGGGKVGYSIAKQLSDEDHHVTVIDNKESVMKRIEENLNVLFVFGNGASIETLTNAGIKGAGMLISVTGEDEMNIVCCLLAKSFGVKYTIARIRNPEYSAEAQLLQEQTGIGRIINPELVAAREVSRLVRFPDAVHVDAFANGKADMIGFRVEPEDGIDGVPISSLSSKMPKNALFCAIDRGGEVIIPHGSDMLEVGDIAYLMATHTDSAKFFKSIGRKQMRTKDVMIAGGGKMAVYLAKRLNEVGIRQILIEKNEQKCKKLSAQLPHATIVCGDATDQETLISENVGGMDYFISATDRDEENIFAAFTAKKCGAKSAIVKINKDECKEMLRTMGITTSVSPKEVIASYILRYVRGLANSEGSEILTLYKIIDGQAEAMEFRVGSKTKFLGKPLKDLNIKDNLLICAIVRKGELLVPGGNDEIVAGDQLIIIAKHQVINDINDILE